MALTPASEEFDRTKRIINEELDQIEELKKMPRRKGLFARFIDFIREKVFHQASYERGEQVGAQIINEPEMSYSGPHEAESGTKPEAEVEKDEMINDLIPGHKNMKIFSLRDKAAFKNTLEAITSKDRAYLNFKDTGYLAKVEKVPITYERGDGTMVKATGYTMSVYNEQGQMMGTIPEKGKEALNLQEMKDMLADKGFIAPISGREFKDTLDDREFSTVNINKSVSKVFDQLSNPYVEKLSYKGIDISFDDKRNIEFTHHVMSKTMGEIDITNNPKDRAKSYEYLTKKIGEGLVDDIYYKEPPHIDVTLDKDKLLADMTKYLEANKDSHIRFNDDIRAVWNNEKNAMQLVVERDDGTKTLSDPAKIHKLIQAGVRQNAISLTTFNTLDSILHKTQNTRQANLTKKLEDVVKNNVEKTAPAQNKAYER